MTKCFRLACLWPLLLLGMSCGDKPDVYFISAPSLKIDPGSAIVGMDLSINAGTVESVQNIPLGWTLSISDDASWRTQIKGNSTVQEASLSPDELKRVIFVVRRNETEQFKFDVSGNFTTSKSSESAKKIEVAMKDFLLAGSQ